ncbi:MAG: hypothetical protein QNJ62_06655 [Methyloceanibacter sp.]|nr:hypothetical protein [Methyloceanibacter sp.]
MKTLSRELIEDLRAAPEGSRQLSDRVLLACGWTKDSLDDWWAPNQKYGGPNRPDPTRNLQDAVDWVVPEGWRVDSLSQSWNGEWWDCALTEIGEPAWDYDGSLIAETDKGVSTPALALCIASLEARESEK